MHPGALPVLVDAIREASYNGQVIITTHSPDLIARFDPDVIRVVEKVDGQTKIGKLEQHQIDVIRDHLFDAGELLFMEGLRREPSEGETA